MVYVDNTRAHYRGMRMSHMVADSTAELLEMATCIGVAHCHLQARGTYREHFDICATKRAAAIIAGAKPVTRRQLGLWLRKQKSEK